MDGLLIDSEVLWHEAEIEILGALGVPLPTARLPHDQGDVRRTRSRRTGTACYPWGPDPTPDEVAVTIVDRVIELIAYRGEAEARAPSTPSSCAQRRGCRWPLRRRRSTASSTRRLIHFGLRDRFAAHPLGRGRGLRQAAPCRVPHRRHQAGGWPAVPRVGGRAGGCAWRPRRPSMACIAVPEQGEGRPAGVRAGRPRGRLAARGDDGVVGRLEVAGACGESGRG